MFDPTIGELPPLTLGATVTPNPNTALGAKGAGEGGCIGTPPAIVNAVIDAIGSTHVRNIDMPLLPDRVYDAVTQQHDVSGAPPVNQGS